MGAGQGLVVGSTCKGCWRFQEWTLGPGAFLTCECEKNEKKKNRKIGTHG